MIDQALYGFEEGVQVGVDGGPNDSVSGVEVSVCEVVAHPGDLTPGMPGSVASNSSGRALTASPISRSRILTASKINPSERSPRSTCERMASIAATTYSGLSISTGGVDLVRRAQAV
jgi:anaerobic C4-dicarboxylate transporter